MTASGLLKGKGTYMGLDAVAGFEAYWSWVVRYTQWRPRGDRNNG